MIGLCCDKIYSAMKNYNSGDENRNKDGNDDNNSTSGSVYNGLIFNMILIPWSYGGGLGSNGDGTYSCCALYIFSFKRCTINCCMEFLVFWTVVAVT